MHLTLRYLTLVFALSAMGLSFSPAQGATSGEGPPEAGKPLGTLWYPGPYKAPLPSETQPQPSPLALPQPQIPTNKPPATVVFPVAQPQGGPSSDKPLGTLWYPGDFNTKGIPVTPQPTPFVEPQPAPEIPHLPYKKPLGTLWYPGPYVPEAEAEAIQAPRQVPLQTPTTATRAKTPVFDPFVVPSSPGLEPEKTPPVRTGEINTELPVHLSADEMSFDQEQGIITASGNVEIINGPRKLIADAVTYNQKTDVVTALGNIHLIEPGGERVFGERMEISGDLRDAVIESIGIILTDRSRIAATGARRSAGKITELRKGVYSPCNLCPEDPSKPPLWQIKSVKIIHDKERKTIEYQDAWLEVLGYPVAYTPYFSHPDPTVKRKSGLLVPSFGGSSDLGFVARVPYYFNISPQQDATVTALYTGDEGSGVISEYRHRFEKGSLDFTGSLVGGDSEEDIRGHFFGETRFDINDTWRWGLDLNRASDDTYLRRYGFGGNQTLNSRLFAEGFRKRNYFAINGYAFQGLQSTDDPDLEPLVLPLIDYNHIGEPDRFGGQTLLDVNFLSLTRSDGRDTRRLSFRPGWQLPFMGPLGDFYKFTFALNSDIYHVNDLERDGKENFSGFSGRIIPQAKFDWRFPFAKTNGKISQIIEPIISAVYTPYGGNPDDIPNEDSAEFEFDDTNLFSANKFSGFDKVEPGPRVSYGLKWGIYSQSGGSSSFFLGQSFRPKTDGTFATGSGVEEKFSDLVGRVTLSPGPHLNLNYRTRFSSDNFTPKRNEVTLSAGVPFFNVNANYIFLERQQDSEFAGREEITYSGSSQLNRFWRAGFSGVTDLAAGETRRVGANLIYENECVVFTTNLSRTFFEDRDLEPTDQIYINVTLKTLGEFRTDIFSN